MPTAVIYARVSSKEQADEGFSIPAQLKLLRDYAAGKGLVVQREFGDVETAKRAGRAGFGEMVEYLKRPRAACRVVLVEKTDRLYRNLRDYVTLDDLDLEIHFVKENFVLSEDSRSTEKFMHGIKVLMAKNYIDNLSEETRKSMREKTEQGTYPSFAPLGYVNVDSNGKRNIAPDPEISPSVQRLYELYATGAYSLLELTRHANDERLSHRGGGSRIAKSTAHKILTNPIYADDFLWGGKRYSGTHEAIVSRELWNQVQQVMDRKGSRRTCHQKHWWAFQGLISCGHCGCAMVAEKKRGTYVYYHCTGNRGKCDEAWVREEEILRQFGEALRDLHFDEEILAWMRDALRSSHADEKRHHEEIVAGLQKRYDQLQRRTDAMYVDKLDGRITTAYFEAKSGEWRREQGDIRRTIEAHERANQDYMEDGIQLLELADRAYELYCRQPLEEQRKLVNCVFASATWAGGVLSFVYRPPFDLIAHSNREYARKHGDSDEVGAEKEIWLPGADSNHQQTG